MKEFNKNTLIQDLEALAVKIEADKNLEGLKTSLADAIDIIHNSELTHVLSIMNEISLIPDQNVTYLHSLEVGLLMLHFRKIFESHFDFEMDLKESFIGGLIHDYGKCFIPIEILNKPSKLTVEERLVMNSHTEIGYDKLKDSFSEIIQDIIRFHHEDEHGTGYYALVKEELSPYSLAASFADQFSAISQERPYKASRNKKETLEIMKLNNLDVSLLDRLG